jgi:Arc/MetJ-type ribon-helix-helix transcriptional regulator
VPRFLNVRLDEQSAAALDVVRGDGLNDSEAVWTALREAAARRRTRAALQDEVRRLAADPADREEMRLIGKQMAELAPATDVGL